jgi:hypothetical protein
MELLRGHRLRISRVSQRSPASPVASRGSSDNNAPHHSPKELSVAKTPAKPILFISHISEEREIADALKRLIEGEYRGLIDVFVSSSPESIHPGQKWLDRIDDALTQCKVEIVIASPTSLRRPWVNFEAGAGWVRRIPVIPICHSGMTFEKLPKPLDSFLAAIATDETGMRQIFRPIADALGGLVPKEIDFTAFIQTVKAYEQTTAQSIAISQEMIVPEASGLVDHERVTLEVAAELATSPNDKVSVFSIKKMVEECGYRQLAGTIAIKMLERKGLIEMVEDEDYNRNIFWAVVITDEGWLWLEMNNHNLDLKLPPKTSPTPQDHADEVPF